MVVNMVPGYLLLSLLSVCYGGNILLLPVMAPSHIADLTAPAEQLQAKGHKVFVALAEVYESNLGFSTYMTVLHYHMPEKDLLFSSAAFHRSAMRGYFNETPEHNLHSKMILTDCTYMLSDAAFLDTVRSINFDLMVVDSMGLSMCRVLLPEIMKVPFIMMGTIEQFWIERVPALPSLVPNIALPFPDRMSLTERVINCLLFYFMYINPDLEGRYSRELLDKYAPQYLHMDDIVKKSQLYIVTRDHHADWPAPSMPHVIHVPGLTMRPGKPLEAELRAIVDEATHGVIVMSLGTLIESLPDEIFDRFISVFSTLKHLVIMRYPVPLKKPVKNIVIMPTIPQQDLLAHPNTKLFITHCGIHSVYEALFHNVPMLGFPIFAEQPHNCVHMKVNNHGDVMDLKTFNETELLQTINKILSNDVIKGKVMGISKVLKDLPQPPCEKATYWIDHVIKHGADHLRTQALDMVWYQYIMLDVCGVILTFTVLLCTCIVCVCKVVTRRVVGGV